ncbi:MAG: hypothetical protein ISN28_05115 [Ectothiorhodospiraceae bacterium AqS1]|nr:hypothetical protein [Ectothiorhodospiraceae bacterium AqS1]MBF2759632.1 hypothetical protein [Ectothiorhodospiraceae bacterium AqS1]
MAVWIAAAIAPPAAHADSPTVEGFLEQYRKGCLRHRARRGHDHLLGEAWCTCTAARFRMEGEPQELETLALRAARGESLDDIGLFGRAMGNRRLCDSVGSFDDTPPEKLSKPKRYGRFTIALPPGFLLLQRDIDPDRERYAFQRIHAGWQSSALLEITIRRIESHEATSEEARLSKIDELLDALARSHRGFQLIEKPATIDGAIAFHRALWEGESKGTKRKGEIRIAHRDRNEILIRLEDHRQFAKDSMAAMHRSLESFRLLDGY